jgi:phenylpyruvate tautomerase PptA (4-oxalocrotonate tautomerase family)
MPLYTVMTEANVLSGSAKADLAAQLTALHSQFDGVPPSWVHIIFKDYAAGSGFSAGKPAATVALTLLIRTGHTVDSKVALLKRAWELLQNATGAPDTDIVIGIQEVPASQAMEMGKFMPDVVGAKDTAEVQAVAE